MPKLSERMVEQCRKQFEAGDPNALLDAIDFCARSGMALPLWVVEAWDQSYVNWRMYRVKTLDEAFDVTRPKGVRVRDREHRLWLMPRVALLVWQLQQEKLPVDEALFERVGAALNIKMGTARDIFYDEANHWREFIRKTQRPITPG